MAEGTYEYECMRAELLGLSKPDYDEFVAQQKDKLERQSKEIEESTLEEVEIQNDDLKHVSGGLEEINHILSITQKKLNRFKTACGSLTNLLKIKVGSNADSTESIPTKDENEQSNSARQSVDHTVSNPISPQDVDEQKLIEKKLIEQPVQNGAKQSDISKAMDGQLDRLESMIIKADNAQYSMAHQNKQMKAYINK